MLNLAQASFEERCPLASRAARKRRLVFSDSRSGKTTQSPFSMDRLRDNAAPHQSTDADDDPLQVF